MCPQPLSTVKDSEGYSFGTSATKSRVELMALVAQAISGWSVAESHLGNTFAALIGAKTPAAMEMYAAFDSFAVQRKMLLTAARAKLPITYSRIFVAALIVLGRHADQRHKFAHCVWGVPLGNSLIDSLLLASPEHFWRLRVSKIRHWNRYANIPNKLVAFLRTPALDLSKAYVYRKAELLKICEQMEYAYRIADALYQLAASKPPKRRAIYNWIRNEPEIRQALEKARQNPEEQRQDAAALRKQRSPKARHVRRAKSK